MESSPELRRFHFLKSTTVKELRPKRPGGPFLNKNQRKEWNEEAGGRNLHRAFRRIATSINAKELKDPKNIYYVVESDSRAHPSEIEAALERLNAEFRTYIDYNRSALLVSSTQSTISSFASADFPKVVTKPVTNVRELTRGEQVSEIFASGWESTENETIIELVPGAPTETSQSYAQRVKDYLVRRQTRVEWEAPPEEGIILTKVSGSNIVTLLNDSNFVFHVEPAPPGIANSPRKASTKSRRRFPAVISSFGSSAPLSSVCVMDSGLSEIPQLAGLIVHRDHIPVFDSDDDDWGEDGHGTTVASLVALGEGSRSRRAKIVSHKIISPEKREFVLPGMMDGIIKHRRETRTFVSSVNMPIADLRALSRLDNFIQKNDVCLVNSVGNIGPDYLRSEYARYPSYITENPVWHPSQNMYVVGVGAIAERDNGVSIAPRNGLSPFTRCGVSLNGTHEVRKPDLVAHGGNLTRDTFDCQGIGVESLNRVGQPEEFAGTSMAAPLVAGILAQLESEYGRDIAHSETLKSVLFATSTTPASACFGHGRPVSVLRADFQHVILVTEGIVPLANTLGDEANEEFYGGVSFRVPQKVEKISLCVVHSDDLRNYLAPALNTYIQIKAFKDGRVTPVPMVQTGGQKNYVQLVSWGPRRNTMLGRWEFRLTPRPIRRLLPGVRKGTSIRYGCTIVLESTERLNRPLTDLFMAEASREESVVLK